ncbi:MAG: D-amino acid aminotransferase [Caulobacteraceae bacterium]|nr:D-amino acid aminotransferase [Caulobacteraceae bacterium]
MSRVAYVNGRYVPHGQAVVHIEDRGFQLADGIYEVWAVMGGKLADAEGHFARLERSLGELDIAMPMGRAALSFVIRETVRRNHVRDGLAYLQVTRGTARRDHAFPEPEVAPTLVVTAKAIDRSAAEAKARKGVGVITTPENRWGRCDIKTIGLLPNVLARQAAKAAGGYEAWFVDGDGLVTEGAASNAWIVDKDGTLRTRDLESNILRGVTRKSLLSVIAESNLRFEERPFTVAEAKAAREAFITGAGALVLPVVSIDGQPVGDGKPGETSLWLREQYVARARDGAL